MIQSVLDSLVEDGFVHIRAAIAPSVLERTLAEVRPHEGDVAIASDGLSYGYAMNVADHLEITKHAAGLLRKLGARPTITQVVLVPKQSGEVRRNWHTDGKVVINGTPPEAPPKNVMLLYYLEATNEENGCLLVLPRRDATEAKGNRPLPGEVRVPVALGDVVILNPELNHAALGNTTDHTRFMVRVRFDCEWPNYKGEC